MDSCCDNPDVYYDGKNGDNVCRSCGVCHYEISLDSYPTEPRILSNGPSINHQRLTHLKTELNKLFELFGINQQFHDYGYQLIREFYIWMKTTNNSLRGVGRTKVSLAIIYQISMNFNLYIDPQMYVTQGQSVSKLKTACRKYFPQTVITTNSALTSSTRRFQKLTYAVADAVGISIKNIDIKTLDFVSNLSKSTKVKAAICLSRTEPAKTQDILRLTGLSKRQILI